MEVFIMTFEQKLLEDLSYFLEVELDEVALDAYRATNSSYNFAQIIQHFAPQWTEKEIKYVLKLVA